MGKNEFYKTKPFKKIFESLKIVLLLTKTTPYEVGL